LADAFFTAFAIKIKPPVNKKSALYNSLWITSEV